MGVNYEEHYGCDGTDIEGAMHNEAAAADHRMEMAEKAAIQKDEDENSDRIFKEAIELAKNLMLDRPAWRDFDQFADAMDALRAFYRLSLVDRSRLSPDKTAALLQAAFRPPDRTHKRITAALRSLSKAEYESASEMSPIEAARYSYDKQIVNRMAYDDLWEADYVGQKALMVMGKIVETYADQNELPDGLANDPDLIKALQIYRAHAKIKDDKFYPYQKDDTYPF